MVYSMRRVCEPGNQDAAAVGNGWSMCAPHRIRKHEESGEKLDPARNKPGMFLVKSMSIV
jgi:hypothetical protein